MTKICRITLILWAELRSAINLIYTKAHFLLGVQQKFPHATYVEYVLRCAILNVCQKRFWLP